MSDDAPAGVTRLVLVRHGEPAAESHGRCYGRLDVGLSERGRAQAEAAAERLEAVRLDAVYTSPRLRAVETAAAIARGRGVGPVVREALREIDFGALEGLTYDEAAARHPEIYQAWMTRPTEVTFPGGESWPMLRDRALAEVASLRARHAGAAIAIVAHGGVTRAVLADALRMADRDIFRLDQAYAGVSVVDFVEDTAIVRALNLR